MQERKIDTFIVKFDKEIKFSDISHYRSGVLASMQHDADVIYQRTCLKNIFSSRWQRMYS